MKNKDWKMFYNAISDKEEKMFMDELFKHLHLTSVKDFKDYLMLECLHVDDECNLLYPDNTTKYTSLWYAKQISNTLRSIDLSSYDTFQRACLRIYLGRKLMSYIIEFREELYDITNHKMDADEYKPPEYGTGCYDLKTWDGGYRYRSIIDVEGSYVPGLKKMIDCVRLCTRKDGKEQREFQIPEAYWRRELCKKLHATLVSLLYHFTFTFCLKEDEMNEIFPLNPDWNISWPFKRKKTVFGKIKTIPLTPREVCEAEEELWQIYLK